MKLKLNVEELISSIKKEALDSGVYRDAMEKTFDSLREIVREIENPHHLICKGKWEVNEYLLSLIKSMSIMYVCIKFNSNQNPKKVVCVYQQIVYKVYIESQKT